jgi:hypothetical protein
MSEPHAAHEGIQEHEPSGALPALFSEEEWQEFHRQDAGEGGIIVGLMTGIFLTGLVLYTTVAIVAAS